MFWLLLILVVGLLYILNRFTSVSNKRIFLNSPVFISAVGSFIVLSLAIAAVNIVGANRASGDSDTYADSLRVEKTVVSSEHIVAKGPEFTYKLITRFQREEMEDELRRLNGVYQRLAQSERGEIRSLGNFGLGVLAMPDKDHGKARSYFQLVQNQQPYLHYCLAQLFRDERNRKSEVLEYEKELAIESGNRIESYQDLIIVYRDSSNYGKLQELLNSDLAQAHFPESLARTVLLRSHNYVNYLLWLSKMMNRITVVGFVAAFAISAMWLVYLFYIGIFKRNRFIWLTVMFIAGAVSCPGVFFIVDTVHLYSNWSMNGSFINDLVYCVVMIGVPEEFIKVLPLLILCLFSRKLEEPIYYITYGAASALGFAFTENLLYFAEIKNGIIHGRAYLAVIGHMTFTSIVAYAFVVSRHKLRNNNALWIKLPVALLLAATAHGIYDVLIFHDLLVLFFIFFVLVVQYWIMMINNAMNNSANFSYRAIAGAESSRIFITLALTGVFALEYVYAGFSSGAGTANTQLFSNVGFACFLIVFFSSNLASYDLIKGYWRSLSIFGKEKRGYGTRQRMSPWFSWYFVNASRAHNYVGMRIKIAHERHNHILAEILHGEYSGRIVDRIILHKDKTPDPYWFLVKMETPLPLPNDRQDYVLVKLRYQEDSLLYEDYVEVFFKAIPQIELLKQHSPSRENFPFYGWATMSHLHPR
jgi:RsiW-degrading membrane proteinase PrsW (M82 family)